MDRRAFIQVMTASGVVLLPSALGACGGGQLAAYTPWNSPELRERDVRRLVLSYGILAPSPHNKQPWIVRFDGPSAFLLYVDASRLLPQTDPPSRQIHIGQGTFLENVVLAAGHFGYRADVTYFPEGSYANDQLENKPVARVDLVADTRVEEDPLFSCVLTRQSNKRSYDETALTPAEVNGLQRAYDSREYPLAIANDHTTVKKLADLITRGMAAEASSAARNRETTDMFRFDDEEINRFRDGFGLPQMGVTGVRRWVAENFVLSRKAAEAPSSTFGQQSVDLARDQAQSAAAFGWITSPANERIDQVKVGRAYVRVNLTATALGVAQHPMSQLLQEYADMTVLQRELRETLCAPASHTIQMLFRLGHAEPVVHAPRRSVDDLIRS